MSSEVVLAAEAGSAIPKHTPKARTSASNLFLMVVPLSFLSVIPTDGPGAGEIPRHGFRRKHKSGVERIPQHRLTEINRSVTPKPHFQRIMLAKKQLRQYNEEYGTVNKTVVLSADTLIIGA